MNPIYSAAVDNLVNLLDLNEIPYELDKHAFYDGYIIYYPSKANKISDVVCHNGSYGHELGLFEMMGLVDEEEVGDSVEGWMTALEVCRRWKEHMQSDAFDSEEEDRWNAPAWGDDDDEEEEKIAEIKIDCFDNIVHELYDLIGEYVEDYIHVNGQHTTGLDYWYVMSQLGERINRGLNEHIQDEWLTEKSEY